jgi:hypothetical protein
LLSTGLKFEGVSVEIISQILLLPRFIFHPQVGCNFMKVQAVTEISKLAIQLHHITWCSKADQPNRDIHHKDYFIPEIQSAAKPLPIRNTVFIEIYQHSAYIY